MANQNFLQTLLEQIHSTSKNLKKDIDENDPRENTSEDLEKLSLNFQNLKELISGLNQQDAANLNREFRELISGQENFQTYVQDVKKILGDVQHRIQSDKKVEAKISNNLPEDTENGNPNNLFQGFKSIIEQISQMSEKANRR